MISFVFTADTVEKTSGC